MKSKANHGKLQKIDIGRLPTKPRHEMRSDTVLLRALLVGNSKSKSCCKEQQLTILSLVLPDQR